MADRDGDPDLAVTNHDQDNVSLLWSRYEIITDVNDEAGASTLPRQYSLSQNYPDP